MSGAVTGAAGSALGTFLEGFCKFASSAGNILNALKYTSKIAGILSSGLAAFDSIPMMAGFVDSDNPLAVLNQKLHSNVLYNVFQVGVSAAAVFSGAAYSSMNTRMMQGLPVCFIAGTMILTAAGVTAIERIKAGDRVLSTNPDTLETAEKTVLETYIRETDKLVYLTVNGEEIITTEIHPFYVNGKGFVDAALLQTGDELVGADGRTFFVNNVMIRIEDASVTVYNFQVEEFHTYHVGNAGILVHNICSGEKPKAPTADRGSGTNGSDEEADYHGKKSNPVKNKATNKGQQALDNSVSIGSNTTRRVGISDGEIVVFDETTSGIFHGHVRSWNELTEPMKKALRKARMVNKKGKIIN